MHRRLLEEAVTKRVLTRGDVDDYNKAKRKVHSIGSRTKANKVVELRATLAVAKDNIEVKLKEQKAMSSESSESSEEDCSSEEEGKEKDSEKKKDSEKQKSDKEKSDEEKSDEEESDEETRLIEDIEEQLDWASSRKEPLEQMVEDRDRKTSGCGPVLGMTLLHATQMTAIVAEQNAQNACHVLDQAYERIKEQREQLQELKKGKKEKKKEKKKKEKKEKK